jgi:uncharacterized C2H2 Zn-finger protein
VTLQPFTRNYEDNSTDAGFQFTFYCDLCQDGYKTRFIESKTYRKSGLLKGLSRGISIGASLLGQHNIGYNVERGADVLSERFEGMSPEWHKEHEAAFEIAQNEAKEHFHRCPRCRQWVCEDDWNEQEGLCTECSPRMNVEVAAIKAERMVENIREKAQNTVVFDGEIESKQTLCPKCGKPTGEGKFCNNCGASIELNKCPRCGAKNNASSRFCGECGTRLG